MTPAPALLLGGGPTAVPVCRVLARSGVAVHALGSATDPVKHSRFCRSFVDLGAGHGVQERWLDWLTSAPREGMVLIPCNDEALELIAHERSTLVELGHRPLDARDDVVLTLLDKHATYDGARRLGIPAPRTVLVTAGDDIVSTASEVGLPLVLKPRFAHHMARNMAVTWKAFLARDEQELIAHAACVRELGLDVVASEIIPGPDDAYHSYYAFVDNNGEPVVEATKHKLRQHPVGFGLATYHVTDRDEATLELGRRFCAGFGVRGLACVEFKRDARDGELKLIECNSRFTAGNELMRHAGLDLALLSYNRVVGRPDPPVRTFQVGERMWHPVEDFRAYLGSSRQGQMTLASWCRSLLHRQHFPLFSWLDPMPSIVSNARLPRRLFKGMHGGSPEPCASIVGASGADAR